MTELLNLTRGVWRPRTVIADLFARVAALLSVYPDETVVCGLTAARLHGLWLPSAAARDDLPIELIIHLDVPVPARRPASYRPNVRARRQILQADEITNLHGLPITSEARTWLSLAAVLDMPDLVAAGDSALRGTASADELQALVRRAAHRPGVVRARAALPFLDGRSRSRPESHLRYALVTAGLPKPGVNESIYNDHGEWLAEPDLSYDDVRLALEYNGGDHAEPNRMRKDITRGVDVSSGGWRTETFGPVQVFNRPDQIVALVRRLRRERSRMFRAASPIVPRSVAG